MLKTVVQLNIFNINALWWIDCSKAEILQHYQYLHYNFWSIECIFAEFVLISKGKLPRDNEIGPNKTDACITQHPFVWRNILVCLLEESLQTKRSIMKASTRVCIPHCRNVENHHIPDLLTSLSAFQAGLKSLVNFSRTFKDPKTKTFTFGVFHLSILSEHQVNSLSFFFQIPDLTWNPHPWSKKEKHVLHRTLNQHRLRSANEMETIKV